MITGDKFYSTFEKLEPVVHVLMITGKNVYCSQADLNHLARDAWVASCPEEASSIIILPKTGKNLLIGDDLMCNRLMT